MPPSQWNSPSLRHLLIASMLISAAQLVMAPPAASQSGTRKDGIPSQAAIERSTALLRTDLAGPDALGLAENAWDFNAPEGVPGFGAMRASDDVQRLVALITGEPPRNAQTTLVSASIGLGPAPAQASEGRSDSEGRPGLRQWFARLFGSR